MTKLRLRQAVMCHEVTIRSCGMCPTANETETRRRGMGNGTGMRLPVEWTCHRGESSTSSPVARTALEGQVVESS